jgi:hypothetical protein
MGFDIRLAEVVAQQPYPMLFATISGAHLYGFPSPDSDIDLRGVHILPLSELLGLYPKQETIEVSGTRDKLEIDLVTHDISKFFGLLLRPNGYVLEQLYSPLIVHFTPEHEELKELAKGCITRHHSHHYLGFAETQWRLFEKDDPRRVKPLLYVFRVLLTGIHLLQTGLVEANLIRLNEHYHLPYIPELIERKLAEAENAFLPESGSDMYRREYERLEQVLRESEERTSLPDAPSAKPALNDLLVRIRLNQK